MFAMQAFYVCKVGIVKRSTVRIDCEFLTEGSSRSFPTRVHEVLTEGSEQEFTGGFFTQESREGRACERLLCTLQSVTLWGLVASAYGTLLTVSALTLPIPRRSVAATLCAAYALVGLATGTLVTAFWAQLLVPGALLLGGYWLSGLFFRDPQLWLERFLLESDRRSFRALALDHWLERAPRVVLELVEASYAADYVVVGFGAIIAASGGTQAVAHYWSLVLASELACYGALPWLRSRPPRVLELPGVIAQRAPLLRRLNVSILDRASVQANTLPSGHVAGAVAAAFGVWPVAPTAAIVLMVMAALIAIAAVVGRYHYVVDCVAGASVALLVWSLM